MNPALVNFAIGALTRAGGAASSAVAQHARDKAVLFPDLKEPKPDLKAFVAGFFSVPDRERWVVGDGAPYAEYWTSQGPDPSQPDAVDMLYVAAVKIRAEEGVDLGKALGADPDAAAGGVMIEQWASGRGPVSPATRVIVTIADIALEYVGSDPSILGIGGRGEPLVGAFARTLSEMIPDDGKLGPKHRFGERLLGIALRAGLESVRNHKDSLFPEEHVRELVDRSLAPVVEALPEDLSRRIDFKAAVEAVSGPAMGAALDVIAGHPEAFLGPNFGPSRAVGALTQAVLRQAADLDPAGRFTREGLLEVYRAALGVAAERPELFLGRDGTTEDRIARELLARFARVLQEGAGSAGAEIGPRLGAVVLGVLEDNVHLLLAPGDPWEEVCADLLRHVLRGLEAGVTAGGADALARVFSKRQRVELVRIVLNRVAATPGMIAGEHEEAGELVGLLASMIAADEDLLLTSSDWLAIAEVVVAEAAANPGRLFHLDGSTPGRVLAADLIRVLLEAARDRLRSDGRRGGAVLFGETLREAITIVLRATSGNPQAVRDRIDTIRRLVETLCGFVAAHSSGYGSKEWLRLFRALLAGVLGGEELQPITEELAEGLLAGVA